MCHTIVAQEDQGNEEEKPMQHFIYRLKLLSPYQSEGNWSREIVEISEKHFDYLKSLNREGQVIFAGRTDLPVSNSDNFGIVIFTAESLQAAEEIMKNDPAVQNGLMTAKVYPFKLVLMPKK